MVWLRLVTRWRLLGDVAVSGMVGQHWLDWCDDRLRDESHVTGTLMVAPVCDWPDMKRFWTVLRQSKPIMLPLAKVPTMRRNLLWVAETWRPMVNRTVTGHSVGHSRTVLGLSARHSLRENATPRYPRISRERVYNFYTLRRVFHFWHNSLFS